MPAQPVSQGETTQNIVSHFDERSGVVSIQLNRPGAENKLTWDMYDSLEQQLKVADTEGRVGAIVLSGVGGFFSTGDDPAGASVTANSKDALVAGACARIHKVVDALILLNKPIIASIDGACFGFPFLVLPLFDFVFATQRAKFGAAVVELAQTPYGCSSVTFPQLMGPSNANEVFLGSRELTAADAVSLRLVSRLFPDNQALAQATGECAQFVAKLPRQALVHTKNLRLGDRRRLLQVNADEVRVLGMIWRGAEFQHVASSYQ